MGLFRWIQRLGEDGCLCLDGLVVEKAFTKRMACVRWTYSLPSGITSLASIRHDMWRWSSLPARATTDGE